MRTDIGKLTEDWYHIDSIVLYGAGTVSRICENLFNKVDIDIKYVIDGDTKKQGQFWNGIPIVSFESIKDVIGSYKIVVMAAHTAFNSISQFLCSKGLKEFKDYCRIGQFMCEWLWNVKQMNGVFHVDMTVTTRCTLNCKHCNMFIPYYEYKFDYSFDELKHNIDLFFERIDYVAYLGLIGGEPTLNQALPVIIEYLYQNYKNQFGKITFTSNGTIKPSEKLTQVLSTYDCMMEISDYSNNVPYEAKLEEVIEYLEINKISYSIRQTLIWTDFGFPNTKLARSKEEIERHLKLCRPEWNGINDGKFYYCNVSWSAEKSGLFHLDDMDYVVLDEIDPSDKQDCHRIVELSRGTSTFCKLCGGCGRDNTRYVPTGIQI